LAAGADVCLPLFCTAPDSACRKTVLTAALKACIMHMFAPPLTVQTGMLGVPLDNHPKFLKNKVI